MSATLADFVRDPLGSFPTGAIVDDDGRAGIGEGARNCFPMPELAPVTIARVLSSRRSGIACFLCIQF
jgi:hypothetical protein